MIKVSYDGLTETLFIGYEDGNPTHTRLDLDDAALWIQQTHDGAIVGIVIDGFTKVFVQNWDTYGPKKTWPEDILKAADAAVISMKEHGFVVRDTVASQ